jgi:hypothetical protein
MEGERTDGKTARGREEGRGEFHGKGVEGEGTEGKTAKGRGERSGKISWKRCRRRRN